MVETYSSRDFTTPRFHLGEVVVNAGTTQYVNQDLFKVSRPTLVDYLYLTEESFTVNGWGLPAPIGAGQHTTLLQNIFINWWITDRARTDLRMRPITMYDNNVDGQRGQVRLPVVPPGACGYLGTLLYRFRQPWRYNPGNTFIIDWSYQTGAATVNAPPINATNVVFYGTAVRSRHRRIFELQVPAIAAAGPFLGSITESQFVGNIADEPYDIDELQIMQAGGFIDIRVLNMLRYRIIPSQGEPFSDDPIPVLAYGIDMFPQGRGAIYAPSGGPMLLLAGQSIGFEVQNTLAAGGTNTRFQAVLVGRTAPNVYR